MANRRRTAPGGETPRVKALKLKGRKHYVLRWSDPATGRQREESTTVPAVDRNRRKALRAAADREAELADLVESGESFHSKRPSRLTVREICDLHLDWVQDARSANLHKQRKSLLLGFCAHVVKALPGEGSTVGQLLGLQLQRAHVDQYLGGLAKSEATRRAAVVAIKATWNWAAERGVLPNKHRPLATVPRGRLTPRDLTEVDLPTPAEVEAVLRWSRIATSRIRAGTGRWRKRRPDEYFEDADARCLGDMLRVYHSTGARTSELCDARVRDFMPTTQQLCLGKHKRSSTQHSPSVRNIQLAGDALSAVLRGIGNKAPGDRIFTKAGGAGWTQSEVNRCFRKVRDLAGEHNQPIRSHITPYSFRHLYISELLMVGVPIFQVAKMAGTSPREIERCYGHFFNHDLAGAQRRLERRRAKRKVGESKGEKAPSRGES